MDHPDRRTRPYNPRYDNPLGPMHEPPSDSSNLDAPSGGAFDTDSATFLGQLPVQDDAADTDGDADQDQDTDAALNQLFAEHGGLTSAAHDYAIDPTLANPEPQGNLLDQHVGVGVGVGVGIDGEAGADAEAGDVGLDLGEGHGHGNGHGLGHDDAMPVPSKRKATSRANMLARGGACEFCKRRKLKCSAEVPTCGACLRAGRECVYSQKKQRSRVRVLEDRLVELEKRLEKGESGSSGPSASSVEQVSAAAPSGPSTGNSGVAGSATGASSGASWASPLMTIDSPMNMLGSRDSAGGFTNIPSDMGFTLSAFDLPLGLGTGTGVYKRAEPDLMTLADAAAADLRSVAVPAVERYEWEEMTPEQIAGEIVKAIEGVKGIGEKIIVHLLQFYVNRPGIPILAGAINAATFKTRLSPGSTSPPHASLILSLLPFLFPLSPSRALSEPSRVSVLSTLLLAPARSLAAHAYAAADPRLLDVIAGNATRALQLYLGGRFLDGWAEASGGSAMAWAAGLGKLGGVGEALIGSSGKEREEKVARERRLREIRPKGVVVEPPKTPQELGERIDLFWEIYLCDKAGAVGWGWPSTFDDEEITTPWPKDDYTNPEALRDNRSILDFVNSRTPTGRDDNDYCVCVKGLTLMYRATRLFDLPAAVATPERTAHLLRVTRMYMSAIRTVPRDPSGASATSIGSLNQSWMVLHATMMLLHAKEELDAPPGGEAEHFDKAIEAMRKVVEHVELAYSNGDHALQGYDVIAAGIWQTVSRTAFRYASRLESGTSTSAVAGTKSGRIDELRGIGENLITALKTLGKRLVYARVTAQVAENQSLGQDLKVGEWERPDNIGGAAGSAASTTARAA